MLDPPRVEPGPITGKHVEPGLVLARRYCLRQPIARGGMAEVWEATDETLDRRVAVKLLLPHLARDRSFLDRFRREAVAAARLAHPNVVETYDTGIDGGLAYIVMELVRGPTLRQVLTLHGPLHPARAVRIACQVAAALNYAHSNGIVHRDVKPANILLGDDDRVKVADFGIAKAAEPAGAGAAGGAGGAGGAGAAGADLTSSGAIVGTAKYLSPEQVNGEALDGRADVYALGVVLYEMVCGQPPFDGDSDVAVALKHVSSNPASPRQLRAGIPRPLEAAVMRALAKRPADRFGTAGDFQSALLSIDFRPDDALAMVVRDPTPPEGIKPVPFRRAERSWMWPTAVIVLVALTLGVVGLVFATTDAGRRLLGGQATPTTLASPSRAMAVRGAVLFDPGGDGSEHDGELALLVDGDPATTWSTHTYESPGFGGLKPGVGVVIELERAQRLGEVAVATSSRGWDVAVYTSGTSGPLPSTLGGWGTPVATAEEVGGDLALPLHGRSGRAVLVWITNLGDARQVQLGEVTVTATA